MAGQPPSHPWCPWLGAESAARTLLRQPDRALRRRLGHRAGGHVAQAASGIACNWPNRSLKSAAADKMSGKRGKPQPRSVSTVDLLANDYPHAILAGHAAPCLSLYQPTHRRHPEKLQDPIRFGNLVRQLTQSLHKKYPQRDAAPLLAPLQALANDSRFWNRTLDGLAVLVAPDFFRVYRLQRPVAELAVVADSFHTKPLLRIMQSADRYQVLALNRREARLFEGNRDGVDEIELAPEVPRTLDDALERDIERERATRTHGPITAGTKGRHGASDVKQDGI